MQLADLELYIRSGSGAAYAVDLRVRRNDSAVDRDLVLGEPVSIDPDRLREAYADVQEYGHRLTAMVFGSPQLREAWATVHGFLDGLGSSMRFRLKIDPAAEELHHIRWETLRDPLKQLPLCRSERFVFSRYVEAGELARLSTRPRSLSRALIAIANPSNLEEFSLSPLEGVEELARVKASLGQLAHTALVSGADNVPVTFERLCTLLNDGCTILYLVCHGTLVEGSSYLWLEQEDGTCARIPGRALVEFIQGLAPERRPLLVVLASCHSSGDSLSADVLAALGPQLARAGVGAVVGMQGDVRVETIERLMPRFFSLLHEDGEVDRALARARNELGREHQWWTPVLYMRVRDGAIWSDATPSQHLYAVKGLASEHNLDSLQAAKVFDEYLEHLEVSLLRDFRQDHFVMLSAETVSSAENETLSVIQQALRDSFDVQVTPKTTNGGARIPITDVVASHRRVVLLGAPGIGKTTSLRFIAVDQMRALRSDEREDIPVWIALNRWRDLEMGALEFIYSEFTSFITNSHVSLQQFEHWIEEGKFLILLDGLNEIPQRKLKTSRADDHTEQLDIEQKDLIPDYRENSLFMLAHRSKSRFIFSCRILEYTSSPGWHEYLVLPLNEQQVAEFVKRHLGADAERFDALMAQQPRLKALTTTPFYLMSLIALAQERISLVPRDRFEIIQYMCQALLVREARKRGLRPDFVGAVQRILGQGACESMQGGYFGVNIHYHPSEDEIAMLMFAERSGLIISSWRDSQSLAYRYLHQLVQEALALHQLRLELPTSEYSAAASLTRVGDWHLRWGKMKEAQENYLRALELCPIVGFEQLRAGVLLGLSRLYRRWWKSAEALKYAEAMMDLRNSLGVSDELADALHEIGLVYQRRRRFKEAEKYFSQALKMREELGDAREEAFELREGLAQFYANPRVYNIPRALDLYHKAFDLFLKLGDDKSSLWTKLSIAHAHRLYSNMSQAEKLFQEILEVTTDLDKHGLLRLQTLEGLGYTYRDLHQYDRAHKVFEEGLNLARKLRATHEFSLLTWGLGWTAMYQGRFSRAREFLAEAYALSQKLVNPYYSIEILFHLGYCEFKAKEFPRAVEYWKQYIEAIDEEYKLSIDAIDKLAIWFTKRYGNQITSNWLSRSIALLYWHILNIAHEINVPSNPLGRWTWRLFWWSQRL